MLSKYKENLEARRIKKKRCVCVWGEAGEAELIQKSSKRSFGVES